MHILNKLLKCILFEINSYYSFQCIYRYVTNILKICMKKFDAKIIFDSYVATTAHCGGYTVSLAFSQFLVEAFKSGKLLQG